MPGEVYNADKFSDKSLILIVRLLAAEATPPFGEVWPQAAARLRMIFVPNVTLTLLMLATVPIEPAAAARPPQNILCCASWVLVNRLVQADKGNC